MRERARAANVGLGAALVLLAAGVTYETANLSTGFSYDTVGPRAFPYLIATGLAVSGLAIMRAGGETAGPVEGPRRHRWAAIVVISATLLAQMFLIRPLGWIPVATVSFVIVAWAFGSRKLLLSILFGIALAVGTFLLFNYGLGLRLPAGPLAPLLEPSEAPAAPAS